MMAKSTNISKATTICNGVEESPTHSKTPSVSSSTTGTITANDQNPTNNRLESMTDDEIIQKNLKDLMDTKNREERKANGRLVAVILASVLIFLAIYHAWIRRSRILAGVLVPAVIMVSFGGWVVVLAKRDKAKRAIFEKYMEEVAQRNRQELEAKKGKLHKKSHERTSSNETVLQYVNEISKDPLETAAFGGAVRTKEHRKNRRQRKASGDSSSIDSSASSKNSSHYATKDLRIKRPSIRQKLLRQTGFHHFAGRAPGHHQNMPTTHSLVQAVMNTPTLQTPLDDGKATAVPPVKGKTANLETKRQRLNRLDALPPPMVRIGSVP